MDCFEHVPVRVVYSSRDRMSPRRCAAWMVQLLRQCGTESLLTEAGDLPSGLPAGVRLGSTSGLPEETRPDWLHIRPVNGGLLLTAGSEIAYSAALDALLEAVKGGKREAAPFENTNPTPAAADASPCAPGASDALSLPSQNADADGACC